MNIELETLPLRTVDTARDIANKYELPADTNTLLALCDMYKQGCIDATRFITDEVMQA